MPRGHEHDVWAVIVRDSGVLVGWVALHVENDAGELGYRFFRSAWGHGYATEASRAVVTEAFARFGVTRIFARTMAANMRSRSVMERLGMRHTATRFEASEAEVEYVIEREAR
jgi:RimJ/RimL family protein N-acetyltransferase